jgi:L-2-hydroxyglutarate oxidase LhgO
MMGVGDLKSELAKAREIVLEILDRAETQQLEPLVVAMELEAAADVIYETHIRQAGSRTDEMRMLIKMLRDANADRVKEGFNTTDRKMPGLWSKEG